jgi:hypothetical protein
MTKTFTRAGVSTNNGKTAFRFTNSATRENMLAANGHTAIKFIELERPMTKEEATEFLETNGVTQAAPKATPKVVDIDQASNAFQKLLAEKRSYFPSHTEQQIIDVAMLQETRRLSALQAA